MRTNRGKWCGCVVAALICCAGSAVAKPEKSQRADKVTRMTEIKSDAKAPMKVVKESHTDNGASRTVELSREKTDEGVSTTRHATVTTASGVQVVRDDTRERTHTGEGTSTSKHTGTTVVTNAKGETKQSQRSSSTMREGNKVKRVSSIIGPSGRSRSAATTVVKLDDERQTTSEVTRRTGAKVERETTREVSREPAHEEKRPPATKE
ncbi:MAG TPA: hypothetical protein VK157_05150 [Phycisphaerales bacterium]|nr:hypothetical protein [Phycisphaerales bacterium]